MYRKLPCRVKYDRELPEDSEEALQGKVNTLKEWINNSKHTVMVTGDDLNSSNGEISKYSKKKEKHSRVPSMSHMAITQLLKDNIVHHIITQSTNGLHLTSGTPPNKIIEIFGNDNIEVCPTCKTEKLHNSPIRHSLYTHHHFTGKFCATCDDESIDNVIKMFEVVPQANVNIARDHLKAAELVIIVGTNIYLHPLYDLIVRRACNLCVVHKNFTSKDSIADLKINTSAEQFLTALITSYKMSIPAPILSQTLLIGTEVVTTMKLKMLCKVFIRGEKNLHSSICKIDCTQFNGESKIQESSLRRIPGSTEFTFTRIDPSTTYVTLKIHFNFKQNNGANPSVVLKYEFGEKQHTTVGRVFKTYVIDFNERDFSSTVQIK
eukprot:gnl/Hemi2/10682_TR3667_c0_g1_i1.p1 gnl/Hemi2/10682_TR3667_c0_g1~~gnl/Hemi2/10682_TR3667_c0_g1_i1.p1  ORF type:complete len:392 (-),score=-72.30 gnl/Hemi2/10682_TR3667_c0_g1_i1:62-1195(-)